MSCNSSIEPAETPSTTSAALATSTIASAFAGVAPIKIPLAALIASAASLATSTSSTTAIGTRPSSITLAIRSKNLALSAA